MPDINDSFYQTLFENIPVLLKVLNQNGTGQFFNKRWLEFTGRKIEQETGSGWSDSLHPEDIQGYLEDVKTACDNRQNTHIEYRLKRADGVYRWILEEGRPVFSPMGVFESYISSCFDITEYKKVQKNNSNDYFDGSTGIPNRRFFDDYLGREWRRSARTVRALTVLICSIDHGSKEDHNYLKQLASAINSELNRPGDFLALYNNEKIAAIMPETDVQGAAVVVNRIRARVQALATQYSVPLIGSASVVPTIDISTSVELVELAVQAMRQAK